MQSRHFNAHGFALANAHFAGDPDVTDGLAAGNVGKMGRRVVARLVDPVIQAYGAEIGRLPLCDRADLPVQSQRRGAVQRGHAQGPVGVEHGGIAAGHLGEQGGVFQFPEYVQTVVAGGAVGTQADARAGGE